MYDVTQIERQLYILSLLSESRVGYSIDEIKKNLDAVGIDVSKKTIERDIDFLSTGNFFVTEEKRSKKTYYMANKFGLENITFSPSELISLHFIKELLKSYSTLDIGNTAIHLVDRIIAQLPQLDKAYLENLKEIFKVNETFISSEKNINQETIDIVKKAIGLNKSLFIKYYSFNNDEVTERKFDPYIIEIYDGCYHLIGYCHLRNSIRDLRVSRIIEAQLSDESFERPKNFYQNYKKGRFGKLSGEEKIKLLLKFKGKAARYVKEYESKKADYLVEERDGSLIFEKNTTMTPEILKWVLSFGSDVLVLEPESLREQVVQEARKIMERYGEVVEDK
ncbi:helix-turn-helix transcriptional regulator [Lutispora thermophila]|uniref:Proteasome accessory factor B n=1 Tax=Lutispora thermophila DSM 19022 TaxID=1122184 RepID=A0A1M6E9D1_9FIRM|nr:WYL domain-containing protein [Lutispora thermophila]SHI81960.1 proteasome accessory factor B [Lutispora thermophila DSM 19022]